MIPRLALGQPTRALWCGTIALAAGTLGVACGGRSAGVTGAGGTPSGGSNAAARIGEAGGGATSGYAPANPDVPPEGDGQLTGGSFEGPPGDGWDFCWPGAVSRPSQMPAGSDGASFLVLYTFDPCETCQPSENDIRVDLWPIEPLSAGETLHLYFDIKNFEATSPTGVLAFGGVHAATSNPCKSDEVLARVPLAELALTSEWQTRCVSLTPSEPIVAFGPGVSDGSYRIGLDTLRFGPRCHESVRE